MWRSEDEERADAWWEMNDWQTAPSSGWWMTDGFGTEGCWSKSPRRCSEFAECFYKKGAKDQKTRRWQKPREKTAAVRAREEEARIQEGAVLSSFATIEVNQQMKVRLVVPPEVPHDTRICIEDLVDMEIDQSKDDEKRKENSQGSGPKNP